MRLTQAITGLCAIGTIHALIFDSTGSRDGPPNITLFPSERTIYFKPGEASQIDCEASGDRLPTFQWKRNGYLFSPDGIDDRVSQLPGKGTIVYTMALDKDEGVYQCFVSNNLGVSVSPKVSMRAARLDEFLDPSPQTLYHHLGEPATLVCYIPSSFPTPVVSWVVQDGNGDWQPVQTDDRVTMDLEGKLRITNVVKADENGGRPYACQVTNHVTQTSVLGPHIELHVMGQTPVKMPAFEFWSSYSSQVFLKGHEFKLKYICGGNPTSTVLAWSKLNGSLSSNAELRDYGLELFISHTDISDAGQYTTSCINTETSVPTEKTFTVIVESAPEWTNPPQDVNVNVGDDAVIVCEADGIPEPKVDWYINGVMLDKTSDHTTGPLSFEPNGTAVFLRDLRLDDRMVIQCNATNKHGYLWGDVSVNVIGT